MLGHLYVVEIIFKRHLAMKGSFMLLGKVAYTIFLDAFLCLTGSIFMTYGQCPNSDNTLNQCWFNVGPASSTLDQR